MKKYIISTLLIAILVSGCGPSQDEVQVTTQAEMTKTRSAMPNNTYTPTNTPNPTATETATATPFPSPLPTTDTLWDNCIPASIISLEYLRSLPEDFIESELHCIYGVILDMFVVDEGDTTVYLLHEDESLPLFILAGELKIVREQIPAARGVLTTAGIGECIITLGKLLRVEFGIQYLAAEVIDIFQLGNELGIESDAYKEISASCK